MPSRLPVLGTARTINRLKGQTTMLFIAHQLPKALLVDEVVRFGGAECVNLGFGAGAANAAEPRKDRAEKEGA